MESSGIDLRFCIATLKSRWKRIVLLSLFVGSFVAGLCLSLPQWYEYSYLVLSAKTTTLPGDPRAQGLRVLGSTGAPTETDIREEAVAFINFNFVDNPRYTEDKERKPYVDSTKKIFNTDYFEIRVRALSLEEAKRFGQQVLNDVQAHLKVKIDAAMKTKGEELRLKTEASQSLAKSISDIGKALDEVGFNALLVQKKTDLENQNFLLGKDLIDLKGSIASQSVRPFSIAVDRPTSFDPVKPRTVLFAVFAAILTAFFLSFGLIFSVHSDQERNPKDNLAKLPTRPQAQGRITQPSQPPLRNIAQERFFQGRKRQ